MGSERKPASHSIQIDHKKNSSKSQTKPQNMGLSDALFDDNGNFLGRTLQSWAKILGFYAVYYSFLAVLFYGFTVTFYLESRVLSTFPVGGKPAIANPRLDMPGAVVHPFKELMDDGDINRFVMTEDFIKEKYCIQLDHFFTNKEKLNVGSVDCSGEESTSTGTCNVKTNITKNGAGSTNMESIVVLWGGTLKPPPLKDWARLGGFPASTPLKILPPTSPASNISKRFQAVSDAPTEAVLCLDDDSILTTSEVDFAFEVWKEFTDRIVGFPSRSHYWDDSKHRWVYSSKLSNSYSMVLTSAAFISRRLASLFLSKLPPAVLASLQPPCEHILVNFLAAHLTKLPPVKVS